MLATGKLAVEVVAKTRQAQEGVLGFEYCGMTKKGKRLMGIIESQAITNLCIADSYLAWEIPKSWSFEDAATVPCVYGTCYYALFISGKLKYEFNDYFLYEYMSTPRTKKSTAREVGRRLAQLKILDAERHDSDVKSN